MAGRAGSRARPGGPDRPRRLRRRSSRAAIPRAARTWSHRPPSPHLHRLGGPPANQASRCSAYDVRFAAPKSVSLLYALGDEEIRASGPRAPTTAPSPRGSPTWSSRPASCSAARAASVIEPGAGFCAMAFRHRMSRAGDPALHTHVVVANMTRGAVRRALALASPPRRGARRFYQHAKAAGYVFQAALRAELTRELGVRVDRDPQRLRRHQRDRAPGDRALLPAPGRDLSRAGRARRAPRPRRPRSPPTAPATPRTTASIPTSDERVGSTGGGVRPRRASRSQS